MYSYNQYLIIYLKYETRDIFGTSTYLNNKLQYVSAISPITSICSFILYIKDNIYV